MTVLTPTIAPDARDVIRAELLLGTPDAEASFVCDYHAESRTITTARLMARGTRSAAPVIMTDLRAGDVVLHNHPNGSLALSDEDLAALQTLAPQGVGFGIVDNTATTLHLAREPRLPWQFYEPKEPSRVRTWTFGRFALLYCPPVRSTLPPIGKAL